MAFVHVSSDDHGMTSTTTSPGALDHPALLRTTFRIDRVSVFGSGVALIAASPAVGDVLAWPTWVVGIVGASLLVYGVFLHRIIKRGAYRSSDARLSMYGDLIWAAGSVAVAATLTDGARAAAPWLILAQATWVADIGIAKAVGFHRT